MLLLLCFLIGDNFRLICDFVGLGSGLGTLQGGSCPASLRSGVTDSCLPSIMAVCSLLIKAEAPPKHKVKIQKSIPFHISNFGFGIDLPIFMYTMQ